MLPGTLTQLCWRESECHRIVTSICAAQLHSCRVCGLASEPGVCSPGVCTRKSSVRLRALLLAWRRLFTLLTCHKGGQELARQSHSRVAGLLPPGILSFPVCWN